MFISMKSVNLINRSIATQTTSHLDGFISNPDIKSTTILPRFQRGVFDGCNILGDFLIPFIDL